MNKRIYLVIVSVLIIAAIIALEKTRNDTQPQRSTAQSLTSGQEESSPRTEAKAKQYQRPPELASIAGYVNTKNITIAEHIGKNVILIDFWTYSCINCQRTIPYLNAWHEQYKDNGLVIIGVHSPEFGFEKKHENVKRAVEKFGIKYPVAQDNDFATWRAFNNRYWPRKYLIDIDGFIVYDHIGEGGYEETEMKIKDMLEERSRVLQLKEDIGKDISKPEAESVDFRRIGTPEIYFGYGFSRGQLGNKEGLQPEQVVKYALPSSIEKNLFYLEGQWKNNNDNMELMGDSGKTALKYFAKKVNIVAGADEENELTIFLDGKEYKKEKITMFDLYNIVDMLDYGEHTLEVHVPKPGLQVFTFTFG